MQVLVVDEDVANPNVRRAIVYAFFSVEGAVMVFGNLILAIIIFCHKPLRRKELIIMGGLAIADLIYGKTQINQIVD